MKCKRCEYEGKIKDKKSAINFAIWYLSNISEMAKTPEMMNFIRRHDLLTGRPMFFKLNARRLGGLMACSGLFKSKRGNDGFCTWRLKNV